MQVLSHAAGLDCCDPAAGKKVNAVLEELKSCGVTGIVLKGLPIGSKVDRRESRGFCPACFTSFIVAKGGLGI